MIRRRLQSRVSALLRQFPAVAILGPRQVGKTTLALALAKEYGQQALYLDLELPSDRAKLSEPELYLKQHEDRLVILDEIHRLPGIFQVLRGLIDQARRKGRRNRHFLLLGSASIDLLQQSAESLAGRIAYQELAPFSVLEVGQSKAAKAKAARGKEKPADRLWLNQGQMLNGSQIASGLGVSGHTVARYLDIMVDLLLVRRLHPWAANAKKRLVRTPKVYVRDSGLLHALLGIPNHEELLGNPILGASWEGMLIENILNSLPAAAKPTFYRTAAGAEIDLVIEFNARERWAIEIKRSLSDPRPSKGFYIGCEDLGVSRRIVLYPGGEAYPLDAQTEVMPLEKLLQDKLDGPRTNASAKVRR